MRLPFASLPKMPRSLFWTFAGRRLAPPYEAMLLRVYIVIGGSMEQQIRANLNIGRGSNHDGIVSATGARQR